MKYITGYRELYILDYLDCTATFSEWTLAKKKDRNPCSGITLPRPSSAKPQPFVTSNDKQTSVEGYQYPVIYSKKRILQINQNFGFLIIHYNIQRTSYSWVRGMLWKWGIGDKATRQTKTKPKNRTRGKTYCKTFSQNWCLHRQEHLPVRI